MAIAGIVTVMAGGADDLRDIPIDHGDADEPFRHQGKQLVLLIARPHGSIPAKRFLDARACGQLAN